MAQRGSLHVLTDISAYWYEERAGEVPRVRTMHVLVAAQDPDTRQSRPTAHYPDGSAGLPDFSGYLSLGGFTYP